jgi:hypothetical protein
MKCKESFRGSARKRVVPVFASKEREITMKTMAGDTIDIRIVGPSRYGTQTKYYPYVSLTSLHIKLVR